MTKKQVTNIAASVQARLLTIAKSSGRDFDAVLLQYMQERFLYRLSQSAYRQSLILKGALLFLAYDISLLRPTRDIDFLGSAASNDLDAMSSIITDIARIDLNDGVRFLAETVSAERIAEDAAYEGVRVKLTARLEAVKKVLQLDIGFGDVIVAGPVEMDFPVLLDDQPVPNLMVYSRESAIAEKYEALVSLSLLTSRMKDIYDILYLAEREMFTMRTLREAVMATFARRSTAFEDRSVLFSKDFTDNTDKAEQWRAFLRRSRLDLSLTIADAMTRLEAFIEPVCSEEAENKAVWNPAQWRWTPAKE
jgi:predicted nucleotidyltransferase component of viral defense system